MQLNNNELYNKLNDNGVSYLYHANTLTTSLGFINNGGLFSRGEMENRGIYQTNQDSDYIDKKYNVWNDVFLDTIDLHGYRYSRYSRQNLYGPVLFEMKLDLLLNPEFNNVWITTNNPTNWNVNENKYFGTVNDYIRDLTINRQQKMITIRNIDKPIPLTNYLNCIYLDDPNQRLNELQVSAYKYAYDKLNNAVNRVDINVNIVKHSCNDCYCVQNYKAMNETEFKKLFWDYTK